MLAKPLAIVEGQPWILVPDDLYIPPDALEVILETFEGPLDLLLYLIKRQNLDILNIPIAKITEQYIAYVEIMKEFKLELAAEYLVMAALLAEIKSRMLLPRPEIVGAEEEDPRAELVRRLQEYEQFKQAAEELDQLPQVGYEIFLVDVDTPNLEAVKPLPDVNLKQLIEAFRLVLQRAEWNTSHQVQRESLSVRERMSSILQQLQQRRFVNFYSLFNLTEGRLGIVVSFIAVLELIKQSLIEIVQTEAFSPIHVQAKLHSYKEEQLTQVVAEA